MNEKWPTAPLVAAAARSTLSLPDIVGAVLAHLQPQFRDKDDIPRAAGYLDIAASYAQHRAAERAARESRSALRAAALVNRVWFAAAIPLLWQCPSPAALAADAVTTLERRAFYTRYIREVCMSWRCPLWRALADASGYCKGVRESGAADDCGSDSPVGRCADNCRQSLPRLASLRLDCGWEVLSGSDWSRLIREEQAPLLSYIKSDLEELEAPVSAALVNCLTSLNNSASGQDDMDLLHAKLAEPSQHGHPGRWEHPNPMRRLRNLVLFEEWPLPSDTGFRDGARFAQVAHAETMCDAGSLFRSAS
jgi:hypothetical protein